MNTKKSADAASFLFLSGAVALTAAIIFGIVQAFARGANDFSVFYQAWTLVLDGKGEDIYRVSPDRYLYGPGFAWGLFPLALLSKKASLALWCLLKATGLIFLIKTISEQFRNTDPKLSLGLSLWGCLLFVRPLMIDFSYGQVNLLILTVCIWALLTLRGGKFGKFEEIFSWSVLTWVAFSKLFPLPLLLAPWVMGDTIAQGKKFDAKLGILLGAVFVIAVPWIVLGSAGAARLLLDWRDALISRGLPLESHNQSFTAFLYHYLSGQPTPVISEGGPVSLGISGFDSSPDWFAFVRLVFYQFWVFFGLDCFGV
jgi:hypothetical protein